MVGLFSVVASLLYLGRILACTWGSQPLGLGDVVFLNPVLTVVFVVCRRDVCPRSGQATAAAESYWADAPPVSRLERSSETGADDSETLRQQKWAADYHWWKQ